MNRKLLLGIIIFLFILIIFLITAVILAKQNLNEDLENNSNDLNYSEDIDDLNYQNEFENLDEISQEYDDLESEILEIT